jgi:hypothetical protein
MPDLDALFASGRVVDLVIFLTICEGLLLVWLRRRTGRGLSFIDIAGNLAAGVCLMLALRAALVGDGWPAIALFLLLALIAHLADLRRRWRAAS